MTSDELPKGGAPLRIMTRVNGEVMQDSNTDDLIFDVPTLVHELSKVMTLDPGDVIITGTPSGVAMARKPQPWLKPGDVCEVEIEKIGVLRNPIVAGGVGAPQPSAVTATVAIAKGPPWSHSTSHLPAERLIAPVARSEPGPLRIMQRTLGRLRRCAARVA